MNIYLDFIGCRLNESEIEEMARQFRVHGHTIITDPSAADLVIVNTCTVTSRAASDSRRKLLHAARSGAKAIIATGCWATLEPEKAAGLPNVQMVIPNVEKGDLVSRILDLPQADLASGSDIRQPLPGNLKRTRAFIKAQEGCNNHCTYCITRIARGPSHSRPIEDVLADVRFATLGGVKEVVLSGIHLASWGQDFDPPLHLRNLVEAVLQDTDIPRLRLSSLEPWDIDLSFFTLWENGRLCRQLHLPLQSGYAATLKRMARNYSPEAYASLVNAARSIVPQMSVTTDIIVGFPGESDQEFNESLEFVRQMDFARGHVFPFSPRPGTPACRMPDQVPPRIIKMRAAEMRKLLNESLVKYNQHFLGSTLRVLWESAEPLDMDQWQLGGLSDNYLRINALHSRKIWNEFSQVRLQKIEGNHMFGEIA